MSALMTSWLLAAALAAPEAPPEARPVARCTAVFDTAPTETPANHSVDAPLLGNGDFLAALANGDGKSLGATFYLSKNDLWRLGRGGIGPRPLAVLSLATDDLKPTGWRTEQRLLDAVTETRLSSDTTTLRLRSWVAAKRNLLVVEMSAEGAEVPVSYRLAPAAAGARLTDNGQPFLIGREGWGGGRWVLDGKIDSLRVDNRAVSDADLAAAVAQGRQAAGQADGVMAHELVLDGRQGFTQAPAVPLGQAVTVSAWVWLNRHAAAGEAQYILSRGEWNQSISLGLSGSQLRLAAGEAYAQSTQDVPTGRWVHLAGRFDHGALTAFVDGQPVARSGASDSGDGDGRFAARRFEGGDIIQPTGAACAARLLGSDGTKVTLRPGQPVTLVVAADSLIQHADYERAVVKTVGALTAADIAQARRDHEAWWRDFWGRSSVDVADEALLTRYYLSNYGLASCSRDKAFPPGLFGWVTTDRPDWNGDYHLNYNHLAPFYSLAVAGHYEQADPHLQPILDFLPEGRRRAERELKMPGVYFPVGLGPKGTVAGDVYLDQKSNSAYCLVNVAPRWYTSRDLAYARSVYPLVRDVAEFWRAYLKPQGERLDIVADAIHEGSGDNVNPILTLGLLRMALPLAADMAKALGVDADLSGQWAAIPAKLAPFPTQKVRDLPAGARKHLGPEWDDRTIFRYSDKGPAWWGDNTLGIQHIYPCGALGLDSDPALLETARNTLVAMSRWGDFNGTNSFYVTAARIGYDPADLYAQLRRYVTERTRPNGFLRGNPHGVENLSTVPNTLQEMLFQSHEGALRLFPCWPRDKDASFADLRAYGAFRVSAALRGGQVGSVTLVSEKGRPATVVNPWPGRGVRVRRGGGGEERLSGERFTVKTGVGERLTLEPAPG